MTVTFLVFLAFQFCPLSKMPIFYVSALTLASSQAKGTKYTLYLTYMSEVHLVPLACEDLTLV